MKKFEQYQDMIARLFPEYIPVDMDSKDRVLSQNVTFQVTDDCNLSCCYCYQVNKGKNSMSFETAKKFVDLIISGDKGLHDYINPEKSPGIIIEFIGGEPFMEIELIDQICDYFTQQLIEKHHPWATKYIFSICSNGVLYFDEKVQKFLRKWNGHISFSVTIDGNKELHDACRKFPDGRPSYDIAVAAAQDWMSRGYQMGSKITIAPENVSFLYDAITHMIDLGYTEINANCVYEKGWEPKHATVLYEEMKKLADYFLENNLDFENTYYCSLYNEEFFKPKQEDDLQSWCFKAGTKILTPSGNKNIEDLSVGDQVISASGKIQTIEKTTKHFATNTCIVKAAGIDPLYTTADHPIMGKKFKYVGFNYNLKYDNPNFIHASDLKKKDKVGLYRYKFGTSHIDDKLAYIIGRYIGDGWCSCNKYFLCCSYDEVDELTNKLNEAHIKFSTYDYRTVKQFNILKSNTELLSYLSDCGHYAHEKKIPEAVFSWDEESVYALLKGLFDADGYYKKTEDTQCYNTVSELLAHDVMTLLTGFGYFPRLYVNKRAGKQIIEGRTVTVRDRYEVSYVLNPSKKKGLRSQYDPDNDVIWSTVYSSESTDPYEVYNLTVSNEHTYIANGVIVHNCGGGGSMLACDPHGNLFPCIRYMESSLGGEQEPYMIGNVDIGIAQTECDKCKVDCLKKINRRTQSTDECFYCPIAEGCSDCIAYNYQVFGDLYSKATFICIMHKARALANVYFWNKYYRAHNMNKRMKNYVPDEWALEIISEKELNLLKELEKEESL